VRARGALRSLTVLALVAVPIVSAQSIPSRTAILIAEDRRSPTPADLAMIRGGLHAQDPETVLMAVRGLGRLERPDLIAELIPFLKAQLPEIRSEAANAIGQAAQGWTRALARTTERTPPVRRTAASRPATAGINVDALAAVATARLDVETDASVRAALCQTIGRLPYITPEQVQRAESTLVSVLARDESVEGRLGVAQGLEALVRLRRGSSPPSARGIAALEALATGAPLLAGTRAERVNRVALEALIDAGALHEEIVAHAAAHADAQVRRLAMRAAAATARNNDGADRFRAILLRGLADASPMVRLEALKGMRTYDDAGPEACAAALTAASDSDEHVVLLALDHLGACPTPESVARLEQTVSDLSPEAPMPRRWHRPAHALVALASTDPDRAQEVLPRFAGARLWELRMYAARAATVLKQRRILETLARDEDDNVCEAAIAGLSKVAGAEAAAVYIEALDRRGYQAVREAARALGTAGPRAPDAAVPALKAALQRLTNEGRDNSRDVRMALVDALEALGTHVDRPQSVARMAPTSQLTTDDLRRLTSARSRITILGVGSFELALFTAQAPATVVRFARLAESGYYNGLTFHRVVPNFVIQGGSPGSNEFVGDGSYMRDEVGLWPHVRGAVGISTRGRDTGDAQIFIDLVDNPRLDHEYTVFGQVLSGMDVVDAILEGDVIEKVEILP
jgi:cyclophilin family peptidyl-prolyl cis-trans isomerase/HEAT repeat protein